MTWNLNPNFITATILLASACCLSLVSGAEAVAQNARIHCQGADCPETAGGGDFAIHGSNTIGSALAPAIIEAYAASLGGTVERRVSADPEEIEMMLNAKDGQKLVTINLQSHGSGTATPGLLSGQAEIGASSRPLKPEEVKALTNAGLKPEGHVLALDGLLILVSPQNRAASLTLDQIAAIFSGQITDWAQVGQTPGKINLYARDDKSGTYDTFNSLVLAPRKMKISSAAKRYESSPDLSDDVARDPLGIGFVGFAYLRNAKALAIDRGCGLLSKPTIFDVKTEEYVLSRRLFLYTTNRLSSGHAKSLLNFALSDQAREAITATGFIDQSIDQLSFGEQGERLAMAITVSPENFKFPLMQQLVKDLNGARRLSVTFRFERASFQLDLKSQRDVERLARFLDAEPMRGKTVLFAGFSDAAGDFDPNELLALGRAQTVRNAVLAALPGRLTPTKLVAKGYGELLPTACNNTDAGRQTNRRVEVWVKD